MKLVKNEKHQFFHLSSIFIDVLSILHQFPQLKDQFSIDAHYNLKDGHQFDTMEIGRAKSILEKLMA